MILLEKVTHWYNYGAEDEIKAVDDVSLKIESGEFVVILGHNGSGKSTLSKMLNALIVPHEGSVFIDEMPTADEEQLYSIRSRVGMVFQNPDSQLVATTVEDELAFGPENIGIPREDIISRMDQALKLTSMEKFRKFAPHRLSGGQKQKIAIASVLTMKPRYLVLDEPTSMLDPKGQKDVLDTVLYLNSKEGIGVILVTQHMHEALHAKRVMVMKAGKLAYDGSPEELFSNDSLLKKLNLAAPVLGQLSKKLSANGIKLPSFPMTVDDMAAELFSIYGKRERK